MTSEAELNDMVERRGKTSHLITSMLKERNQLLSLMLQVSDLISAGRQIQDADVIVEFRQVLVDYIAAAHFGLYERISEGKERRKVMADMAVEVYPRIEKTTALALAFDEKYGPENENPDFSNIQQDLSKLGEELATRIELEDKLIQLFQQRTA